MSTAESEFERHDRFSIIPLRTNGALTGIWRRRVIALNLEKGLLNLDFARKLLGGEHSGFSRVEPASMISKHARPWARTRPAPRSPTRRRSPTGAAPGTSTTGVTWCSWTRRDGRRRPEACTWRTAGGTSSTGGWP